MSGSVGSRWRKGRCVVVSVLKPVINSRPLYAKKTSPLRHCVRVPTGCQPNVLSRVIKLCLVTGPSAISRFIIAIVVDAIQRSAVGRSPANIGYERSEGMSPCFIDRYSSTAVILKLLVTRVRASLFYLSPNVIFRLTSRSVHLDKLYQGAR